MVIVPLLAITLVLLIFEAGFQLWKLGQSSPFAHRIPDPVLGWRLEPGAQYTYAGVDFHARVNYSQRGWRDTEYSITKPTGSFRVLLLGDSYMEGYTVDLEQSLHRQLQQLLRIDKPTAEVINFGVGGYGTLQSTLAFEHFGQALKPDLVLLGFFLGNDISNNSQTFEQRRWPANSRKIASRPFLQPGDKDDWEVTVLDYSGAVERYQRATDKLRQQPWWRATSAYWLYGLARKMLWSWHSRSLPFVPTATPAMPSCDDDADYQAAWAITTRILARLDRTVRAVGAQLLVFTVPMAGGNESAIVWLSERGQPRHQCRDRSAGDKLAEVLARQGISLLRLGPAFRQASGDDPKALMVRSEGHWNADGHRLAAEQVYRSIVERGLMGTRP